MGGAPRRTVLCEDALPWLAAHAPLAGCSLITSLPDVSAFPALGLDEWRRWFIDAARLVLAATPDEGVAIFYQSDVKRQGTWIDKGYLCQRAAEAEGAALLWHKIVCRKPPGTPGFGRPAYSHLVCFSRAVRDGAGPASPDVLEAPGEMVYSQAMGLAACELACAFVRSHTKTRTVVDPFCGQGSVLAMANHLGLDAIGVEIARKRARKARSLSVDAVTGGFSRAGPPARAP